MSTKWVTLRLLTRFILFTVLFYAIMSRNRTTLGDLQRRTLERHASMALCNNGHG